MIWTRRRLCGLGLAGLVAAPARAADPLTVVVVPFRAINAPAVAGFKVSLAEQSAGKGRGILYEELPATGDLKALEATLPALLARKPALVFVVTTPASQVVVRMATLARVPVVFSPISDPLAAGLVRELKRPGGVATGVRLDATNGMRLALLLKAAPHVRRVYVPYTRSDASAQASLGQVQGVQAALGVELMLRPMADGEPAAAAIETLPAEAQAVFLLQDSRLEARVDDFVAAAVRRRLPLSVPSLWQVERGALMSFGFDLYECGHQAGRIAARVLAGESPAHLPVETASNRLWLNLRAAEQIGLSLPDALLRQAHRILR